MNLSTVAPPDLFWDALLKLGLGLVAIVFLAGLYVIFEEPDAIEEV